MSGLFSSIIDLLESVSMWFSCCPLEHILKWFWLHVDFVVLGMKSKALDMLCKDSATKLCPHLLEFVTL